MGKGAEVGRAVPSRRAVASHDFLGRVGILWGGWAGCVVERRVHTMRDTMRPMGRIGAMGNQVEVRARAQSAATPEADGE